MTKNRKKYIHTFSGSTFFVVFAHFLLVEKKTERNLSLELLHTLHVYQRPRTFASCFMEFCGQFTFQRDNFALLWMLEVRKYTCEKVTLSLFKKSLLLGKSITILGVEWYAFVFFCNWRFIVIMHNDYLYIKNKLEKIMRQTVPLLQTLLHGHKSNWLVQVATNKSNWAKKIIITEWLASHTFFGCSILHFFFWLWKFRDWDKLGYGTFCVIMKTESYHALITLFKEISQRIRAFFVVFTFFYFFLFLVR